MSIFTVVMYKPEKMRALLLFVVFGFSSFTTAFAAERSLLDGANSWRSSAGGKSKIEIASQNPLQTVVEVGGGSEGFPNVKLSLPKPEDWREYTKIVGEINLETDDPGVSEGGKEIAFCIYDSGLRHDYLNGNPSVQQLFAKVKIQAGDWQETTIDLRNAVRGGVNGLDIYLYDMPYNYPHSYTISFRNLRLVGPDTEKIVFDGETFAPDSLKGNAGKPTASIQTQNGLTLTLGENGGIAELSLDGKPIGNGADRVSGILVRDSKNNKPPKMAGGIITHENRDEIRQYAEIAELDLKLATTFHAESERIVIDGQIESTNAEDRAVTVYVALPITPGDWSWCQSLSRTTKPFDKTENPAALEDGICSDPLVVLADAAKNHGLGLILDQKFPVVYRFIVNPKENLVYAAFDFALINQSNSKGFLQQKADFHLELVRTDPAWGFRSGLEKLYTIHSEYFTDRVGHGGGWECGGYRRKFTDEQNLLGAYRFDWSATDIDKTKWEWNKKNGIENLIYIEPDFLQFSMGDFERPTPTQTMSRMVKLTENDTTEWEKLLPLHYSKAFNCNPHPKSAQLRPFLDRLIESIRISGMYEKNGKPISGLGYRPGWIGNSGFGAMIPANLAPEIPGGRGEIILKYCLGELYDEYLANGWTRPDGFGLDCFMDVPDDYRRENFQYMSIPLSFDPATKQPMVPQGFGSIEWVKKLREEYIEHNGLIMANAFGPMIFAAPYLDIFGIENTQVYDPGKIRSIAGPKRPITFLSYTPPAKEMLDYHLIWGIYPGRNIEPEMLGTMVPTLDAMYEAGWQPVSGVKSKIGVHVERFGKKEDASIYVGIYNPKDEAVNVDCTLYPELLGKRSKAETIYNGDESIAVENDVLNLRLEAKQTKILRLGL